MRSSSARSDPPEQPGEIEDPVFLGARLLLFAAAVDGFVAVAVGAFAAHGLEGRLTAQAAGWIETGSRFQLIHAVAAMALALAAGGSRLRLAAGWAMAAGAFVFALALYGLAAGLPRSLGAIAPIGGAAMIAGWILVASDALVRLPPRWGRG